MRLLLLAHLFYETTIMHANKKKLIDLMDLHNISCDEVGKLLNRKGGTVRVWRCKNGAPIPTHQLDLLVFKLGEGK